MTTFLWFLAIVGGPVLLGAVIAYALLTRRELSPREAERRDDAIKDMYEKPHR